MKKLHRIKLDGQEFTARSGQVLLDAALMACVDIPHDCRAGRCGACLTQVQHGITLGGDTMRGDVVHACQARVFSDLTLAIEQLPPVVQVEARLISVVDLTPGVVQLTIAPEQPLRILPGQYCRFSFHGYPARAFSPTMPLDGQAPGDRIFLNVKRVRDGRVSSRLGGKIRSGHQLTIEGPYGHAFLRTGRRNRLVLAGSGTGFAPIWAVARTALHEDATRSMVIVAGARELRELYMAPALEFACRFPNVRITLTVEEQHSSYQHVLVGRPSDFMPELSAGDIVYAAGAPKSVETIGRLAKSAGATFFSDPFEPAGTESADWLTRAAGWLRAG